ncbi:MAG: hypothetical protein K0R93_3469 [Anaerosolibacter sp.]|jgi:hypothetical protein|nr:hypothetical protein [Anaerosolibacter sp.]
MYIRGMYRIYKQKGYHYEGPFLHMQNDPVYKT